MSRPETQLREYFDAGVERVSVEDVIARAGVGEGGLRPLHAKRNLQPAWAAVGAFAATLVGLGGLASVLSRTPRINGDAGAGVAEIAEASGGGSIGVWLIAAAVAAVAAGSAVWLVHRSTKRTENEEEIVSDQGRVMVMETIERTDTEDRTTEKMEHRSRRAIVVMAIALVGLIAWMTLMMRPTSPTAAPPEVVELMEEYTAAWNAYDADALEAVVTSGYQIHGPDAGSFDHRIESLRSYLMPQLGAWDWHTTNYGPYYAVAGDSPGTWYVSAEGSVVNRNGTDHNQNSVWMVVERDGTYLVNEHFMMGG